MNQEESKIAFEALNIRLTDDHARNEYKSEYDSYKPSLIPRILGTLLIISGTIVYGKKPSYQKFRAIEIIARVPYQSWVSVSYTFLTCFFWDEVRAMSLSKRAHFAGHAQDNETMHVVVISTLTKAEGSIGVFRHTLIPMIFGFIYFWMSYLLYFIRPRLSYELNFLFEQHAFEAYNEFVVENAEALRQKPMDNLFLNWYGRTVYNQYDFFVSVRNDELIHRNMSLQFLK
jgi:ubiquinol oxidase